jgi:hypothetical protein
MKNITLFLTSDEYKPLNRVRQVKSYERRIIQQMPCLVIVVDPPLEYPDNEQKVTSVLYLTYRFVEQAKDFINLSSFPIYVHVSIPKSAGDKEIDSFDNLLHIAWAEIYDKLPDTKTD